MLGKDHWKQMGGFLKESLKEHKEVVRLDSTYIHYSSINTDTLLMVGGKSPKSKQNTMRVLDQTIPKPRH
jgi:hypothetical protein